MSEEEVTTEVTAVLPTAAPVTPPEPEPIEDILAVIARAAADPRVDVDKMERLLLMKRSMVEDEQRTEFFAALARVQMKIPHIDKAGVIMGGGGVERNRYALYEDIDRAIRPILSEEGFAISFNTVQLQSIPPQIQIVMTVMHRRGWKEERTIVLSPDASGSKNAAQAVLSAIQYGRRGLIKMFFNVVEEGLDDDGSGGSSLISGEQELKIHDMFSAMEATEDEKSAFLRWMGVAKVTDILDRDFKKAMDGLTQKLNKKKGQ
jgi:hypothetical protein